MLIDDFKAYNEATQDIRLKDGSNFSSMRFVPVRVCTGHADSIIQMPISPRTKESWLSNESCDEKIVSFMLYDVIYM